MLETTNHNKAPKEEVESLLTLYYQGKFHLILEKEEQFTFLYPDSIEVLIYLVQRILPPTVSKSHY